MTIQALWSPVEYDQKRVKTLCGAYSLEDLKKMAAQKYLETNLTKPSLAICVALGKLVFFPDELGRYHHESLVIMVKQLKVLPGATDRELNHKTNQELEFLLLETWKGGSDLEMIEHFRKALQWREVIEGLEERFCSHKAKKSMSMLRAKVDQRVTQILDSFLNWNREHHQKREYFLKTRKASQEAQLAFLAYLDVIKKFFIQEQSFGPIPPTILQWFQQPQPANKQVLCNVCDHKGQQIPFTVGDYLVPEVIIQEIAIVEPFIWLGVSGNSKNPCLCPAAQPLVKEAFVEGVTLGRTYVNGALLVQTYARDRLMPSSHSTTPNLQSISVWFPPHPITFQTEVYTKTIMTLPELDRSHMASATLILEQLGKKVKPVLWLSAVKGSQFFTISPREAVRQLEETLLDLSELNPVGEKRALNQINSVRKLYLGESKQPSLPLTLPLVELDMKMNELVHYLLQTPQLELFHEYLSTHPKLHVLARIYDQLHTITSAHSPVFFLDQIPREENVFSDSFRHLDQLVKQYSKNRRVPYVPDLVVLQGSDHDLVDAIIVRAQTNLLKLQAAQERLKGIRIPEVIEAALRFRCEMVIHLCSTPIQAQNRQVTVIQPDIREVGVLIETQTDPELKTKLRQCDDILRVIWSTKQIQYQIDCLPSRQWSCSWLRNPQLCITLEDVSGVLTNLSSNRHLRARLEQQTTDSSGTATFLTHVLNWNDKLPLGNTSLLPDIGALGRCADIGILKELFPLAQIVKMDELIATLTPLGLLPSPCTSNLVNNRLLESYGISATVFESLPVATLPKPNTLRTSGEIKHVPKDFSLANSSWSLLYPRAEGDVLVVQMLKEFMARSVVKAPKTPTKLLQRHTETYLGESRRAAMISTWKETGQDIALVAKLEFAASILKHFGIVYSPTMGQFLFVRIPNGRPCYIHCPIAVSYDYKINEPDYAEYLCKPTNTPTLTWYGEMTEKGQAKVRAVSGTHVTCSFLSFWNTIAESYSIQDLRQMAAVDSASDLVELIDHVSKEQMDKQRWLTILTSIASMLYETSDTDSVLLVDTLLSVNKAFSHRDFILDEPQVRALAFRILASPKEALAHQLFTSSFAIRPYSKLYLKIQRLLGVDELMTKLPTGVISSFREFIIEKYAFLSLWIDQMVPLLSYSGIDAHLRFFHLVWGAVLQLSNNQECFRLCQAIRESTCALRVSPLLQSQPYVLARLQQSQFDWGEVVGTSSTLSFVEACAFLKRYVGVYSLSGVFNLFVALIHPRSEEELLHLYAISGAVVLLVLNDPAYKSETNMDLTDLNEGLSVDDFPHNFTSGSSEINMTSLSLYQSTIDSIFFIDKSASDRLVIQQLRKRTEQIQKNVAKSLPSAGHLMSVFLQFHLLPTWAQRLRGEYEVSQRKRVLEMAECSRVFKEFNNDYTQPNLLYRPPTSSKSIQPFQSNLSPLQRN